MGSRHNMDDASPEKVLESLLRPRIIEEKMLVLLRQGRLGKWFSGMGQEAISVGAAMAMPKDEYLLPLHRNLGVFTTRGISLERLLHQFRGDINGFTKGRDRSFHFGSTEHHLVGMISHLGPQLAIATGIALSEKLSGSQKAVLVFTGEGATSEGDFHESLNLASVWGLPVIFLVENNGYALSTPIAEQYHCEQLVSRAAAYGMEATRIDGNRILEVIQTVKKARRYCINEQKPYLIECMTFRMRGHEEASGTSYVPSSLLEEWGARDPIANYVQLLKDEKLLNEKALNDIRNRIRKEVDDVVRNVFAEAPAVQVSPETELNDVYAPAGPQIPLPATPTMHSRRFIDAISDGLRQAMHRHPNLLLMGQDIADYGGVFKVTEGFLEEFGKERIRNTPLCESAVIGAAFGLQIAGYQSVVEMQFADFISMGFNQVVNNLAKSHYRWGQPAGVVIRMPTGAGTGAGPFHSQSTEAWFIKTPGLKVVYPAFPDDAKGLLAAAVEDPNPVLFFEHKHLYRTTRGDVPDEYYTTPIGKARLVREGQDASIITYGLGVHWALDLLEQEHDISVDLLDLRSLQPWDRDAVITTIKKTGRALILHEDTLTGGFGAEIAAFLSEHCFRHLDAPVVRCCSLDTPVPMNPWLEAAFLARFRLSDSLKQLLAW
ncbi:MAG TPA: dehydrogenase E1 component subunit alpha/beta [Anseongella sp.]